MGLGRTCSLAGHAAVTHASHEKHCILCHGANTSFKLDLAGMPLQILFARLWPHLKTPSADPRRCPSLLRKSLQPTSPTASHGQYKAILITRPVSWQAPGEESGNGGGSGGNWEGELRVPEGGTGRGASWSEAPCCTSIAVAPTYDTTAKLWQLDIARS